MTTICRLEYMVATDDRTDEMLMHAFATGDARAFEVLYDRYERRIFGFFMRALGDRAFAEDLLQQTFLNLHRARRRYRGGGFAAWIPAIAYNVYRQERRRRARKPEAPLAHEPSSAVSDPGDRVDAAHLLDRVRQLIEALPACQREAVVLTRLLELDHASAAELAGCTPGAMKLRAFRGLRALHAALDVQGESATELDASRSSEKKRISV